MFKFVFATVALVLSSQLALGSPLTLITEATTIASTFPVRTLDGEFIHPNVTINKDGARRSLVARQEFPASILLCAEAGCPSCSEFSLANLPEDECFITGMGPFTSVAISQPSDDGLPFAVAVGPRGCASFVKIPTVDVCFNVNGGTVSDFALL